MESLTYAYLQPLNISDKIFDDVDKDQIEFVSTDHPVLTPIKEELVAKDLRSYFLIDEPDSLPIIWVEVQPKRNDFAMKKTKKRKQLNNSIAVQQSSKKKQYRRPIKRKKKKNAERKVSCRNCDRKFVTNEDMNIHAATHLRKKQKDCFVCGRRFSHGGALCLHMRTHKFARSRK